MDFLKLFEAALGLTPPWKIDKVSFDPKADGGGAVEIRLTSREGATSRARSARRRARRTTRTSSGGVPPVRWRVGG